MVTTATLNRQVKAVQTVSAGNWVKFMSDYVTNAFEAVRLEENGKVKYELLNSYQVTVTNIEGKWFFYAEEHEVEELIEMGYQTKDGFKALKDAKKAAESFCESFRETFEEAEAENT